MTGFYTLLCKEVMRFWKVSLQTVLAPVLTSLLYLLIFSHALAEHIQVYPGIAYTSFLIPGLVMMTMLQNAFANTSSSLIQSKITGNIVFMLLPPLSAGEIFAAYILAALVRALTVGAGLLLACWPFVDLPLPHLGWLAVFAILGTFMLGSLGIIAGIWAEKFDQLAGFQNFLIVPLTFLAGVFYSTHTLPPFWREASHLNPFFYLVDGFRHSFFHQGDVDPWFALVTVAVCAFAVSLAAILLLRSGYKLRH